MKRVHLFEIHDQEWLPRTLRDAETDYLQFVVAKMKSYAAMVPVLAAALRRTGARRVLDLASGAGGPWFWLQPALAEQGVDVSVRLTNKYPNAGVLSQSRPNGDQPIRYHSQPVDAGRVPDELTGFRTLFSAFHHFRPAEAQGLLADAVRQREGIAVFEGTENSVRGLLAMLLVPLMVLLVTPFIRPFRWSRLWWTYLVPVVPFLILFDGLVSCLRTYSVAELRELTAAVGANDYHWDVGVVRGPAGPIPITYLVGVSADAGPDKAGVARLNRDR